jgi:tetratricopeptide (TPR) repeat protein
MLRAATPMLLALILAHAAQGGVVAGSDLATDFRTALDRRDFDAASQAVDRILSRRFAIEPDSSAAIGAIDSLVNDLLAVQAPAATHQACNLIQFVIGLEERAAHVDSLGLAQHLADQAVVLGDYLGEWDRARSSAVRALTIRRSRLGSRDSTVAENEHDLARLEYGAGRYAQAESLAVQSLVVLDSPTKVYATAASAWITRGEAARALGDYGEAESALRRCLEILDQGGSADESVRPYALNSLAGLYKDWERYDASEALLAQALAISEQTAPRDLGRLAAAHLNLAEVHRLQGRMKEARPDYQQALDLVEKSLGRRHPSLLLYLNQYAAFARDDSNDALAESLYAEAGAIAESLLTREHPYLAYLRTERGLSLERQGRWAEAEAQYRSAYELRRSVLGQGNPETASSCIDLARVEFAAGAEDSTLLRRLAAGTPILDRTSAYPDARMDGRDLRARIAARGARYGEALSEMDSLFVDVDSLRARRGGGYGARREYLTRQQDRFDRAIDWAVAAGQPGRAYRIYERARARQMLDRQALSGADLRASLAPESRARFEQQERGARAVLAQAQIRLESVLADGGPDLGQRMSAVARLQATVDSAAFALDRVLEAMREASPKWQGLFGRAGQLRSIAQIQEELVRPGRILLAYHLSRESGQLFLLRADSRTPEVFPLVVSSEAAEHLHTTPGPLDLQRAREAIFAEAPPEDPDAQEILRGAREISGSPHGTGALSAAWSVLGSRRSISEDRLFALFESVMPPGAWKSVERAQVAILIPDGALSYVPFEACVVEEPSPTRPPTYWLDRGPALVYAPSANAILRTVKSGKDDTPAADGKPILSVCDPRRESSRLPDRWARLDASRRETERWRVAFGDARVRVLCGESATEDSVRVLLPGRKLLHFASHAFVTEGEADFLGGLVLAAPSTGLSSGNDGFLQVNEIAELDLHCRLAILSACETYTGPYERGEGVFSLSRSFIDAGAERVIASLWPVESDAAEQLVGGFGEALARVDLAAPGFESAALLRDAKRQLRHQRAWSHPYYWASFVQAGIP